MNKSIGNFIKWGSSGIWIIHPIFFFIYSILSLLATNQTIPLEAVIRSLIIGVGLIVLCLTIANKWWDGERLAVLTSGAIILFFSYGHLINLIETYSGRNLEGAGEWLLILVSLIAVGLWAYYVVKRIREISVFTRYFLVVSLLVNIPPILQRWQAARYEGVAEQQFTAYQKELERELDLGTSANEGTRSPGVQQKDIYYIVLDAYARADVLKEIYGYDNRDFIQFLEERGFFVAGESHANYVSTELSLASSLNMSHIRDLPDFFGARGGIDENSIKKVASDLIYANSLQDYLHRHGYTIISIESGYSTGMDEADIYLQLPDVDRGSTWRVGFEAMLLDSSFGRLFMKIFPQSRNTLDWLFDLHRERILYAFDHLADFTQDTRPTFVYAHVISPHTPYVFGPNGERIDHQDPFTLLDANPGNPENLKFYRDQVHYVNTLVMEVIKEILETSASEPIIILQADHGSKVYSQADPPPEIQCRLYLPILNAYYFPGDEIQDQLYESISPVNSFRVLLNEYFQEELDLLDDRSFELVQKEGKLSFEYYEEAIASCK